MSDNTINKINALLSCDPHNCRYLECPCYLTEARACNSKNDINMITTILYNKFNIKNDLDNKVIYENE